MPDDGQPLPGYTFDESIPAMIDSIDEPVRWKEKVQTSLNFAAKPCASAFLYLRQNFMPSGSPTDSAR